MKITFENPDLNEEDEIIVRCRNLDDEFVKLISQFREKQNKIIGYQDKKITQLLPREIFYFESVENKVFAYCEKDIFEVRLKLYEIEYADFLRISKSTVLNLSSVHSIKPLFNGRFEANLKNGENVIISRQYVPELKKALGIKR